MRFILDSIQKRQIIDLTDQVQAIIQAQGWRDGICHIMILHTTAALTTADLDPGTDLDMLDAFAKIIPNLAYRHPHDPAHVPDHILASIIGPNLNVPVQAGQLVLGTWQRLIFVELDGPRAQRQLELNFLLTA